MEGMRKFWVSLIVIGALLLGLVVMLAFKALTEGMWTAWCVSVASTGGAYAVANVVTKKVAGVVKPKGKK
jgi:hypothetical protein